MLAVLGFTTTAVLFLLFALTLATPAHAAGKAVIKKYKRAYFLLAVTFLCFGIAAIFGTARVLSLAVLASNGLLLIATLLLISILFEKSKYLKPLLYTIGLSGALLILVRILYFYPKPYMRDSMLFFNSQRFVSFLLSATFLLIWLPVNLLVSQMVTQKSQLGSVRTTYTYLYAAATISAIMFLLAKRPVTLVMSFTALSLAFAILVVSNLFVKSVSQAHHGK